MALLDLLPEYYSKSPQVAEIQGGLNCSVEALEEARIDLYNQVFVDTATWGLSAWEEALKINTDISKSYEFRRERIKAKLRGAGSTTKSMMKQMAAAYSNGEVEVIEDNSNYGFVIKFVGTIGIPANMPDLIQAIEEIKPAHLSYTFEYIFNTLSKLTQFTHARLSQYTHAQLREEVLSL